MKLLRLGARHAEVPAILDTEGRARSLSGLVKDITPEWLAAGGLSSLANVDPHTLPLLPARMRVGAPISRVGKIVCVGLNYSDHAAETNQALPTEPILFLKAGHALQGPDDDVHIPRGSVKTDWEVELGVMIARRALYVSEESALDYVAGYCVCNDVSERAYQMERGGQWDKGKNCDTFGPVGPWLVTPDDVPTPERLHLWLSVNGHRYQDGTTATMVFQAPFLIHYISHFMPLEPGDIISTGTPPGVGLGQKPPVYLRAGDTMHLGIDGLGEQRQNVIAEPTASRS